MSSSSFLQKFNVKQKIVFLVLFVSILVVSTSLLVALKNIETSLVEANKNKTRAIVELMYNLVDDISTNVTDGKMTLEQAQQTALNEVSKAKYDGQNYVWVTTYEDDMLSHPTLEGKNIANVADKNGIRFFHDGVVIAKEKGEGFVSYHWTKQG